MRTAVRCFIVIAFVGTASACSGEDAPPACEDPEATTSVEMLDFDYAPACVEASAGDTLDVSNTGEAPHTFTVDEADLNLDVPAGEEGTLTLEGVTAGTVYEVRCVYHTEMTAALTIA
jgi:plastocyanin